MDYVRLEISIGDKQVMLVDLDNNGDLYKLIGLMQTYISVSNTVLLPIIEHLIKCQKELEELRLVKHRIPLQDKRILELEEK